MSRIRLILLAALAVFAVAAVTSASASALEWYRCFPVTPGTGKFEDNHCQKPGGTKEFEKELIKGLLKIIAKQTESYTLEGKLAGVTVEIKCEEQKATGSIHNGLTGKDLEPGKGSQILVGLGLINNEFKKCKVEKPAGQGCKVAEPIQPPSLIQLSTVNGKTYLLYSPDPAKSETIFVEITLSGCTTTALNNTFPITGMAAGLAENATGTVSFKNEEPNKKLFLAGNAAVFKGASTMEMENGGIITAET